MEFYRARETDFKYIKSDESLIQNTTLIASEGDNPIGTLEYEINNIEEVEIKDFTFYDPSKKKIAFKGLVEEIIYWHPYLKRIIYNQDNKMISKDILKYAEFKENSIWILNINNHVEIFKIDIGEIVPEQLTVSKAKVDSVNTWIEKPEDIVVTCVEIENQIVCIDGYSRLVAAYIRDFNYVYAYLETDNDNIEFYKTCMKWCQEEKVFAIKDLANRIVSSEEHERLWINRCQRYLNNV